MEHLPDMAPLGPGSGVSPPPTPQVAYVIKPRPRWRALRIMSGIIKVLAWITAGFSIIAVLFAVVRWNQAGGFGVIGSLLLAMATAVVAGALVLCLYIYAELILVLVAIEANTRKL